MSELPESEEVIDFEGLEIASEKTKETFLELVKELLEKRGHDLTAAELPELISEEFEFSEVPEQSIHLHYFPHILKNRFAQLDSIIADVALAESAPGEGRLTFFTYHKDGSVNRVFDRTTAAEVINMTEEQLAQRMRDAERDKRLGIPRVSEKRLRAFNELLKSILFSEDRT